MQGIKKKIHICLIDPNVHDEKGLYSVLRLDNREKLKYEFVWDEENPQFVIVSDLIYTDPVSRQKFGQMYNDFVTTIFIACECVMPDLNLFDYAVCFDDSVGKGRVISHVHRNYYREYILKRKNDFEGNTVLAEKELLNKTGFCNFIYSNANGHENREKIFYAVSEYKRIDSLGAFLNNTNYNDGNMNILDRVRNSIDLKSKYKFTIAFENATHRGYTSEKVFTSLEAHSIPIYWGNPEIGKIVNEKAIINCHQYDNFEQVVEKIKEIDSNDRMWCKMVCEPWLTKEQEIEEKKKEEEYYHFLEEIFLQENKLETKRGSGTYTDLYRNFFFGSNVQYEKNKSNLDVCIKWIQLLHKEKSIADFLITRKYRIVAVYGMGALGVAVYEELEKCEDIKLFGLDKGNPMLPSNVKSMRPYEVNDTLRPDVVVVTVMWDMDNISRELDRLFQCDIYSLQEIIDSVLEQ